MVKNKKQTKKPVDSNKVAVIVDAGRYINLMTDFGFKRAFGTEENSDLLVHFLNSVLETDEGKIVSLQYLNVEQPGRIKTERGAFFDLNCLTDMKQYIIVEMQNIPQIFFKDRALFYASRIIQKQGAKKKKWNYELRPVYSVNILNFKFSDSDDSDYIHYVQLINKRTGKVFYKKLTFVFIELSDFDKSEDSLHTIEDLWIYVLRNISRFENIPEIFKNNEIFKKLFLQAEIANMTPEELEEYDQSLKNYRNMYGTKDIVSDYQKAVKGLQRQNTANVKIIAGLQNQNKGLQSQNKGLQNQNKGLQREVTANAQTIAELQKQLAELNLQLQANN